MRARRRIFLGAVFVFVLPLTLWLFAFAGVAASDGTIREADYPIQYKLVATATGNKMVMEKACQLTLRDPAKPNVDLNVAKTGVGACPMLELGKSYRGRLKEKKNQIELVIPVGEDKARIETWQIVGIVNNPATNPAK